MIDHTICILQARDVGEQVPKGGEQTEERDEENVTERSHDMSQPRDDVLMVHVHSTVLLNLQSIRTKLVEGDGIAKSIRVARRRPRPTRKID